MLSEIKRARGHVAAVRAHVLSSSPGEVEQCIPALQEAILCVLAVENPAPELAHELSALHFELGIVKRLVQRGAEFYEGWAKVLTATAGYTAAGNPAPLPTPASLSVKG